MPEAVVRELWTYPVKGCQGTPVQSLSITKLGIVGDREFVLWHDGQLVDQKETPRVASLAAEFDSGRGLLTFRHAELGEYAHSVASDGKRLASKWILDEFETIDQGDAVADWLSRAIGLNVRLVSPGPQWKINFPIPQFEKLHGQPKDRFFAASPVSLANQASLDDLNGRLESPVPMDRFRMNVVVDGLEAFAEDQLEVLRGDEVELLQVTPAERCVIITTDQRTGERRGSEVMKVLGEYRRKEKEDRFGTGLIFGNYMGVGREGILRVGDRLSVA